MPLQESLPHPEPSCPLAGRLLDGGHPQPAGNLRLVEHREERVRLGRAPGQDAGDERSDELGAVEGAWIVRCGRARRGPWRRRTSCRAPRDPSGLLEPVLDVTEAAAAPAARRIQDELAGLTGPVEHVATDTEHPCRLAHGHEGLNRWSSVHGAVV